MVVCHLPNSTSVAPRILLGHSRLMALGEHYGFPSRISHAFSFSIDFGHCRQSESVHDLSLQRLTALQTNELTPRRSPSQPYSSSQFIAPSLSLLLHLQLFAIHLWHILNVFFINNQTKPFLIILSFQKNQKIKKKYLNAF